MPPHAALEWTALRERLRREREASRSLGFRADVLCTQAREIRRLVAEQHRCWRRWHRMWGRVAGPGRTRVAHAMAGTRPLVRVCMYCGHVYVALPLARGEDEADVAWHSIPWWVWERLGTGVLRIVPSHGICPPCERRLRDP